MLLRECCPNPQVDHTYDRSFIIKYLGELESLLVNLINRHLTDKSVTRVEQVSLYSVTRLNCLMKPIWASD